MFLCFSHFSADPVVELCCLRSRVCDCKTSCGATSTSGPRATSPQTSALSMEPHFRSTQSGLNRLCCVRQKPQLGLLSTVRFLPSFYGEIHRSCDARAAAIQPTMARSHHRPSEKRTRYSHTLHYMQHQIHAREATKTCMQTHGDESAGRIA